MPSSVIRAFSYDSDIAQLRIAFRSGRTYLYSGVPEETYLEFCVAPSKGRFFNTNIRDHFAFSEVVGLGASLLRDAGLKGTTRPR